MILRLLIFFTSLGNQPMAMNKKIFLLSLISLLLLAFIISCNKSSPAKPTGNWNVMHALSDTFYIRGLLDTFWLYTGNSHADECQQAGVVCSSFTIFGPNYSLLAAQINLTDSSTIVSDSVILSWAGKTFYARTDTTQHQPNTFTLSYPDTLGRTLSSDYVPFNTSSKLVVNSVSYDGLSTHYLDSLTPYKMYRLQGTITCKMAHFNDSVAHNFTQGVFSINVLANVAR